jgi:hypothetical protein
VAASRGTAMHTYLEHHIEGQGILDLTEIGQEAERMAKTVIDKGFPDLEEIWGSEVTLYYPGLYAGATDLCGVYQGPIQKNLNYISSLIQDGDKVLEIGPGAKPFSKATEFCGWTMEEESRLGKYKTSRCIIRKVAV